MLRYLSSCLFVLALASTARANGRPPVTNGVYFQPGDASSIYVRSTFGLLISHDDGCSFRWVCEQNIGYGGTFDPTYAIAADGTVFATTFAGLRVSRDGGCSFTTATAELPADAPGRIADIWVDALDLGPTGEVWVATAESGKPNDVYRSTDNGVTFTARGLASPTIWWKSLAVAPADALTVYASGYEVMPAPAAHLRVTTDGGETWTAASLADVTVAPTPIVRVVAVHPEDPQHVYIVSVDAGGASMDRLYRSTDGGATFTEVLATTQSIADVVLPDASTVLVAAGEGGTFRSTDGGLTFAAVADAPRLGCLGARSDGSLVGCAANWDPDFMAVGTASADAGTWQKIFRFIELAGPVACPAGTPQRDQCDAQMWPTLQQQFGVTGPTCGALPEAPPPPAGSGCCDAGSGAPLGAGILGVLTAWLIARRRR